MRNTIALHARATPPSTEVLAQTIYIYMYIHMILYCTYIYICIYIYGGLKPSPRSQLLAGLLCAGLWPNVAVLHAPRSKPKKGIQKPTDPTQVRLHTRQADLLSPDPEVRARRNFTFYVEIFSSGF